MVTYLGLDVGGAKKGQALALLDDEFVVHGLWLAQSLDEAWSLIEAHAGPETILAIDAPRQPAPAGAAKRGRPCERELHKEGFRLQWSPLPGEIQDPDHWMAIGFEFFRRARERKVGAKLKEVLETFPTASYARLPDLRVKLHLGLFERRNKVDQLDALCCALTAWCYAHGQYRAYGDEEQGQIIVPQTP